MYISVKAISYDVSGERYTVHAPKTQLFVVTEEGLDLDLGLLNLTFIFIFCHGQ